MKNLPRKLVTLHVYPEDKDKMLKMYPGDHFPTHADRFAGVMKDIVLALDAESQYEIVTWKDLV